MKQKPLSNFEKKLIATDMDPLTFAGYTGDDLEPVYKPLNKKQKKGAAKALAEAKKLIEEKWVKGSYKEYDYAASEAEGKEIISGVCAVGAIQVVDGAYENIAHAALTASLPPKGKKGKWDEVESFNDAKKTTKKDVLNLFTRAINYLK